MSKIPSGSLVKNYLPANYSDVYTYKVKAESLSADDIQVAFWTDSPKWVKALMDIRNSLVKFIGLKGESKDEKAFEECIRSGGVYDMASIVEKSDNETIIRLDDSHLSAHISIHIEELEAGEKLVSATTLVHFYKKLGYVYFYAIMPFHHFVVKYTLKRSVQSVIAKL